MNRDAFAAIADPTRREIMSAVARESLTINQLSDKFIGVSRQAVTKQINFLADSGLLKIEKIGREKYCYLYAEPLNEVNAWIKEMNKFWEKRLDNLENYLSKK
jgi:DNA-binding transcriptional ArsR family regulator